MRVLLLSPGMFVREGGIERLMRLYLKALCELCGAGGHLHSLALNDAPHLAAEDAATENRTLARYANAALASHEGFGRRKARFAQRVWALARRTDLIICGHINQLIVARLARLINPRLRYCLVAHGIEVWRPYRLLERWALRGAARILCVSEFTRQQMRRFDFRLKPALLKTVFNALDPQLAAEVTSRPASATLADSDTETPTAPIVLSVGRLTRDDAYKGFDTLIEAMPAVRQCFPAARLRIVGTGDDLVRLHDRARACGVDDAVDFLGRISDEALASEYAACTVFAMPSRAEGFGLVYLEAMVRGKPCLAAKAGGAPEVIGEDGGCCVSYGNTAELTAAIGELLRCPPAAERVRRLAQAFSFERFRERLAAALPHCESDSDSDTRRAAR